MKPFRGCFDGALACLVIGGSRLALGEQATLDLPALIEKARPAVTLLVKVDARGKEVPAGTGFLVSSNGLVVTDHHVIQTTQRIKARTESGGLFPVSRALAEDEKADLVVLKIDAQGLPWLPLGKSASAEAGTSVAVIGSSLGPEGALSEGTVNAVRGLPGGATRVVQISAAVSPSSIGAPVLDAQGKVIGVAASLVRRGQSFNFAIPVKHVKRLVAKAEKSGRGRPPAVSPDTSSSNRTVPTNWAAVENGHPERRGQSSSSSSLLGHWRIRPRDLLRLR
ncbi:MAG: trypsin-like peptidase domain-containing protein [Candidatus Hydrogenedentes bacterium]|nr:trypsin-like peptidase domain-containing protein [Candidatus Hydrogenedentota bacterium]